MSGTSSEHSGAHRSTLDFARYPEVSRIVDLKLYSRRAIVDAQTAFKVHCQVQVRSLEGGRVAVTLKPLPSSSPELRAMVLEFWNFVLDTTCQSRFA